MLECRLEELVGGIFQMQELLLEMQQHNEVENSREPSVAALHTETEPDVLSVVASHSLKVRPIFA